MGERRSDWMGMALKERCLAWRRTLSLKRSMNLPDSFAATTERERERGAGAEREERSEWCKEGR